MQEKILHSIEKGQRIKVYPALLIERTSDPLEAKDIGDWFLQKGNLSMSKLQNLVYCAYAIYLLHYNANGIVRKKLFQDDFIAAAQGPRVLSLYTAYKHSQILQKKRLKKKLSAEVERILEKVWDTFSDFTEEELATLIQRERAWKVAREKGQMRMDAKDIFV